VIEGDSDKPNLVLDPHASISSVIVYETSPSSSVVAAMGPLAALGVVGDNAALAQVAREADTRLRQALGSLEAVPA